MKVGVVNEDAPGERRVALVPETVPKLKAAGADVLVEKGAGEAAWYPDTAYADAGAVLVDGTELYDQADVILTVTRPSPGTVSRLRAGQAVFGLLAPLIHPELAQALADQGVTAVSLDRLPRTLTRTQPMDALSSQANVAGYKAAVVAASEFGRFFPLLITAAGTARPAKVLVLGAGVAGLQAIGTSRRLGAVVSGYDVRPASKNEVESLGATFIELTAGVSAAGGGGAGRAARSHQKAGRDHHHGPGARPPAAAAGDRGRAEGHGARLGHRGHGRQRAGRQRGGVPGGPER